MMRLAHFANSRAVVIVIHHAANAFHPTKVLGLVFGKDVILHVIGVAVRLGFNLEIGRIAAQFCVVIKVVNGVKAKTVNATVQPKAQHAFHVIHDFWVVIIEVGLFSQKVVQIVLLAARIPCPCRSTKDRQPVVRWCAIMVRIDPNIPIGFWIAAILAAFLKKRVPVG